MSSHLSKAKLALEDAAGLDVDLSRETLPRAYARLIDLAFTQATVAQAEALERLADAADLWAERRRTPKPSPKLAGFIAEGSGS